MGTKSSRRTMGRALVLIALGLAGCDGSRPGDEGRAAAPAPLRVAAASDLQNVLPTLVERFTRASKVEVSLTFGASGQLAEQIKNGAPFDVFLAANQAFVQDLADGGFVRPDSVRPYALGALVLAVHPGSAEVVGGLTDLAKPEVKKIALANPSTAPYGAAAKQALERSGLWSSVEPKLVQAETVRQALQFVETGNAEAGFAGHANARTAQVRVVAVDPKLHDPIVQALGVVARSKCPEEAEAFARFVLGDGGQDVLVELGSKPPQGGRGAK
ncbi:MAG TPA: molybdate ABC transporter substrate-binding protein [Isosphaeraceae bacterium]|nr:molybdate ABC transporter substrate-binding protein [Isosphaeraceae bacterium]